MRALLAPALVLLVLAVPLTQACHPGPAVQAGSGAVLLSGELYFATIHFSTCEGSVPVTVDRSDPLRQTFAPVVDYFEAELDILAPGFHCLFAAPCDGIYVTPPPLAFRLSNEALGVDLHGVAQNGAHFTSTAQMAGSYFDGPGAFGFAAG